MELNDPGEKETNKPERRKKASKIDQAVTLTLQANPNANKAQIVKNCIALGAAKHPQAVYNRLRKKDYLQAEIQTVRDSNRQYLDRIIVPKALKSVQKAINNKDLDEKGKFPYIKLAIDKSFGDIHHTEAPQVVNIESIQNAQFLIKADLTDDIPNIEA